MGGDLLLTGKARTPPEAHKVERLSKPFLNMCVDAHSFGGCSFSDRTMNPRSTIWLLTGLLGAGGPKIG